MFLRCEVLAKIDLGILRPVITPSILDAGVPGTSFSMDWSYSLIVATEMTGLNQQFTSRASAIHVDPSHIAYLAQCPIIHLKVYSIARSDQA